MNIDQLLEQYFEGLTSSDEETILRDYFTSDNVPERLMMYKPLFVFFENEITKTEPDRQKSIEHIIGSPDEVGQPAVELWSNRRKAIAWWLSAIAACAAILIGSFFIPFSQNPCTGTTDYVMIDGRCYTDASTIRSTLLETLHEVTKTEDLFSVDQPTTGFNTVENQLKEFNFLLDE